MQRKTNHFGSGMSGQSGIRPPSTSGMSGLSGIRPPTASGMGGQSRTSGGSATSGHHNNSSFASTRKVPVRNFMNMLGSGGSTATGRQSFVGSTARKSLYGNIRNQFSSARKSEATKPLFGLTPQHKRQSFMPNTASSAQSGSRRSSIGGNRYIADSRPLSDSGYHKQCVTKLVEFLTNNPIAVYPHTISKTLATRPTGSEISKIFEFLFSCYGLKCKVSPMEIEIPKVMAAIEYPFPVKKSDLQSFTNGRVLGSVLGMLEWLIDSLTYLYNMEPIRTFYPNFEGETDVKTELIGICLRSNAEELDTEQIDSQIHELIVKTHGTEDDYEQLVDEQETLDQELHRLEDEMQQIKDLPNSILTYQTDIKNYDQYMNELKAHHKANEDILENLKKELNEKLDAINKLEEQRKNLKIKVNEQAFGFEEAVLAKERKQQLEEEIRQELAIIDDIKKSIRGSRLECSKFEDIIKKMHSDLDSFITAMTDMVDSPVMSNYSSTLRTILSNKQWNQILEQLKNINGETNATDIIELEKLFSKRVSELKIAIVQQLSSLKGCVSLAEQQKLNELNHLIGEKEKQLAQNEKQISQLVSDLENTRKEQVSEVALLQKEIDETRQMLSEMDGTNLSQEKANLIELRKQVKEKAESMEREHKTIVDDFEASVKENNKGITEFSNIVESWVGEEKALNLQLKTMSTKF